MATAIQVLGKATAESSELLTPEALAFVAALAREFEPQRRALMQKRAERQAEINGGHLPDFLPDAQGVRHTTNHADRPVCRAAPLPHRKWSCRQASGPPISGTPCAATRPFR